MREVIFKHLTSAESRKKDIVLKEAFEKNGVLAKTERRCFYFIKDVVPLDTGGVKNLDGLAGNVNEAKKRCFHILKEHNDRYGEDKIICKILGTFYAVVGGMVYTIAFLHSFKAVFMKTTVTG